ncbi:MAG: hypothetical protein IJ870_00145 [Alphaproteobacteria bacterium]|nr:hypothetical protein [Alphaproteobacteria bacterium]
MLNLFKYIVIFFLSFNISNVNASEVTFEPTDDEQSLPQKSFTNASSLPHPVQLREMINTPGSTTLGQLFILAQYFEARYPDQNLDIDFSDDVALIFPEMSADEVQKTTKYIKTAISLYRFGKEKIADFQKEKLAPKDPPLMVSDDQYAILGDRPYLETPENEVAVISDFKKVIGYGSNPREIEAFEAFYERQLSSKTSKTDFEHFRTMLSKINWSELTSYGTTKPSPFVGNAGIGAWVEADSFRARLISDTARIGKNENLIIGLHLSVPNHRFMLASNLSDNLQKPKIQILDSENLASIEIFDPLPVQITSNQMIGAYRGDFAFPIKIKLAEPNKPLKLQAKITFENCDTNLDCTALELSPSLELQTDENGHTTASSMSNFAHQSLYNIPQAQNKYITLENISYTLDEKDHVSTIDFVFKRHAKIKNFALFLENEDNSLFSSPSVVSDRDLLYVQVKAIENTEGLLKKPLRLTVRLNDYATLRQSLSLIDFGSPKIISSLKQLFIAGFRTGFLFLLTPFGFVFILTAFFIKNRRQYFIAAKAGSLGLVFSAFLVAAHHEPLLAYFSPTDSLPYLCFVFICIASGFFAFNINLLKQTKHPFFQGLTLAFLMSLFLPVSQTPYGEQFVFETLNAPISFQPASVLGLLCGLLLPDLCAFFFSKKRIARHIEIFIELFSKTMLFLALSITALWIFFELDLMSALKTALGLFVVCFVLKYIFHFWTALYQTDLKLSYIRGTEKVLTVLVLCLALSFSFLVPHFALPKMRSSGQINLEQINEKILNGENLIIALTSPNCLVCKYNDLTLFNTYHLEKYQKLYNLTYLPIESSNLTQNTIEFLQKYKRLQGPLYVFYTALAPNGVVLPNLMTLSDLHKTFENFNLYPSSSSVEEILEKRRKTPLR